MRKAVALVGVLAMLSMVACGSEKSARREDRSQRKTTRDFVELSEMMKIMEGSKVEYTIAGLDKLTDVPLDRLADFQWQRMVQPMPFPAVEEKAEGGRRLVAYPMEQDCLAALEEVEPLFVAKKFGQARQRYSSIRARFPTCYLATVYLGDAFKFDGDEGAAEKLYQEVITANPADYRGYFFRAGTLVSLGKVDEALEHYAKALTLKPGHENILVTLNNGEEMLGLKMYDHPFQIHGFARKHEQRIEVFFPPAQAYWLAFAVTKAAWMGEPEVRRRMGAGPDQSGWSSTEDRHALIHLVLDYLRDRKEGKVEPDPQMDRLDRIVRAHMLDAFILYELGSRIHPHATLLLPPEDQQKVQAYVKRFVMGMPADETKDIPSLLQGTAEQ